MISIVVSSIIVVLGLIAVSQYYSLKEENKDNEERFRYKLLVGALVSTCACIVAMSLLYGSGICYVLYAINRFLNILIMSEIVLMTEKIIHVNKKISSVFITVICYYAVALFFVDTIVGRGELKKSNYGVFYAPIEPWHRALHFAFYLIYIVTLLTFLVYRASSEAKRREKYELSLLFALYSFSAIGYLSELFVMNYALSYAPISVFFNLLSIIALRYVLNYHKSIQISKEDYARELAPNRTEVVFILDDQLRVIFMNRRAQVLSQILRDPYMGRRLTEIFSFVDDMVPTASDGKNNAPYGLSAEYPFNNRHVNMVVQHYYDKYDEILATSVMVYNMEERVIFDEDVIKETELSSDQEMINSSVSITRDGRVLIVDNDAGFMNSLQKLLTPFEVRVSRANSGPEALERMKKEVFDIIFMAQKMDGMDGFEAVKKIRALDGEYFLKVPVVLMGDYDVNEVYINFLDVGFSDYYRKNSNASYLGAVLSRWLWQRFDVDAMKHIEPVNAWSGQYDELRDLLESAEYMYDNNKIDMLLHCLNAMKRVCTLLALEDVGEVVSELETSCMFEDTKQMDILFDNLKRGIRESISNP